MKTDHRTDPEILRQRAEELVSRRPAAAAAQISVSEATRLIHELEVHQAELELQNEELRHSWAEAEVAADKYAELYDFAPLGYMSLSEKGEIIELNLCASQMLEKDRTRLKHSQFSFYIAGESKPVFNQFLQKIFNHRINQTCEVIMTNSSLTCLHLAGSLSETKGHCLLTMVDITGSKQAEIKLRESERMLRESQEVARLGSYIWDLSEGLWISSKILDDIFGIDEKYTRSFEGWAQLIHPAWREIMRDYVLMEVIGKHSKFDKEYKIVRQDNGQECWVHGLGQLELDQQDQPVRLIGTITDISKRKLVEAELKLKNQQLMAANAEKDKFFSILAHDLRSPFNAFLGLTRIMVEDLPSLTSEEIQGIALSMKNSATNLFNLLENLLDWARIQQGLMPFNPEEIPLLPIVNDSLSMAREPAMIKEIELIVDIPGDLIVFTDTNVLQAVIRNIVSNAVKFTPRGGTICISADTTDPSFVELSVKDTGIGMTQAMIDSLFRLDVQTSRKGTEGEHSSGLGLLICNDLIEKHSGRLRVESEVGRGSTFYISLPGKV